MSDDTGSNPTRESLRAVVNAALEERIIASADLPGPDHVAVPAPPLGKVKALPVLFPAVEE